MRKAGLIRLLVNGEEHSLAVPGSRTLLEALRYDLMLTGSKQGCDKGDCGACTVLSGGQPILSCITLAHDAQGLKITTIEGLASPAGLDPVQRAFAEDGTPTDPGTHGRAGKFFDELEWYACALRDARDKPRERSECAAQQAGPKPA